MDNKTKQKLVIDSFHNQVRNEWMFTEKSDISYNTCIWEYFIKTIQSKHLLLRGTNRTEKCGCACIHAR